MRRLITDVKAGKVAQSVPLKQPPPQSKGFSTGRKVAAGVAAAAAVIVLVILARRGMARASCRSRARRVNCACKLKTPHRCRQVCDEVRDGPTPAASLIVVIT
jgi:hypothetical protein